MNTAGVQDALEELGDDLSDVQKSLQPLLTSALSETTKKLPLLDRAKLYTTIVYAIESLLFCRSWLPCELSTDHRPQPTSASKVSTPKNTKS